MRKGKKALLMFWCSLMTAVLMIAWPVPEMLEVETAVIQRGELVQTALMSGLVYPKEQQLCISPGNGRVSRVFVTQGQEISEGDLLFKLDTTAEEQALSALYERRFAQQTALTQMNSVVSALSLQNELEWQSLESQLLAAIEASQLRAAADGVMEAVYVREGEYVAEMTLLGTAHGTGVQIMASAYESVNGGIHPGAAAVASIGNTSFPVQLATKSFANEAGMQTFCFELMEESEQSSLCAGEQVKLEVTEEIHPLSALIPLAAIDAEEKVWIVENGRAYAKKITLGEHSRTHASAELVWADETVILYPDAYDLENGTAVRVKQ